MVLSGNGHPPYVPAAFRAEYEFGDGPHPHVHGANPGIPASACLSAGGFRSLRTADDHALLAVVTGAGHAVLQPSDITVRTSGRRLARAPSGPSHLLRMLRAGADREADNRGPFKRLLGSA